TTYNANNQVSMAGYGYDSNGRMTSNGTSTFVWDARNQLASIAGAVGAQFSYDALGRRARKSKNSCTTPVFFDGGNYLQELGDGSAPTLQASIVAGFGVDEVFGRTDGTTKVDFVNDGMDSTLALSDSSSTLVTTYSYEPYGKTSRSGAPTANSRAFT